MKTSVGVLSFVLVSGLSGCRDLGLPGQESLGDAGLVLVGGTELTLLAPDVAVVQPQLTTVRVRLSDVNGLRGATLGCGDVVLASWLAGGETERELERRVDLGPCRPEGTSSGGVLPVELAVQTVDATGVQQNHGPFRLQAHFAAAAEDGTSVPAELVLEHPLRVVPHAPIVVGVRASEALAAPPRVTIDGVEAAVSAQDAESGGGRVWTATLPSGLSLGAPATGPADLPPTERAVAVRVTAVTHAGAATQATSTLTLSHVQWERALPFPLYVSAGRVPQLAALATDTAPAAWLAEANPRAMTPVATAEGLVLAVRRNDTSTWAPVRLEPGSGALQLLPEDVLADNWTPSAFDRQGRVLLAAPLDVGGTPIAAPALVAFGARPDGGLAVPAALGESALVRVGDGLCQQETLTTLPPDGGLCPEPAELVLSCLDGAGTLTRAQLASGMAASAPALHQYGSGEGFLGLDLGGDPTCCPGCERSGTVGAHGQLVLERDVRDTTLVLETFERIIPDHAGGFAVLLHDANLSGGASPMEPILGPAFLSRALFLHADGTPAAPLKAVAGRHVGEVLGAAPGDVLVTLRADAQAVRLQGWRAGTEVVVWERALPGGLLPTFESRAMSEYDDTSLFDADGSGVALMDRPSSDPGATRDLWVVGFGPGLAPAWTYRYPLRTSRAHLYASPDGRRVYVVDEVNATVVAFAR